MLEIELNGANHSQNRILAQLQERLFTNGPVTIFRWVAQEPWSVEYVSPNVRQWGYEAEDFLSGRINYSQVLHPDDVASIVAEIEAYESARINTYRQDYRIVCANGEVRWVHDYSVVVRNSSGVVTHYEGYVLDITERKQGESALKESEEKFAKAFRCSPDAMTITRLKDGCFIDINKSFLDATGYTQEEVIEQAKFNPWVNPAERAKVYQILQRQGSVNGCEYQFRHKSGTIVVGLFSAEVVIINGEPCVLSVTTDITERKRTELEVLRAAQREKLLGEMAARIRQSLNLQEILETTVKEVRQFLQVNRVYIVQFDRQVQGQIVAESVTDDCSSLLAWKPRNEAHIKEILEYFIIERAYAFGDVTQLELPPEIRQDFLDYQVRSFLAVPIVVGEQIFGHLVANQCNRVRLWEDNEIDFVKKLANQLAIAIQQAQLYQQVQSLNTDLEGLVQKRTEELYHKVQELQELYRIKDVFLHAFSHDLRTPIMGTSLVLNNFLNQDGETLIVSRSILKRLQEGSEKQLNLINALLEAHSSEVSGIVLYCQPLALCEFIQEVIADLEPLANKYKATLINLVNIDFPLVNADVVQLRRVFENLITNAFKYNPPGVTVTVNATSEANRIRCTVADDGIGINLEQQEHLFDLYYRGSQSRASTGIGLGLYLCRQIIKSHGGDIGINSLPGEGTTFWFTLLVA
ncbi:PAS domain S-box protein [Coleofasciculus sp. FACHB-712]|uniref:sensor histidine kinase n=1 Tax=Coleofasciculus sp. FACHB-712 TaxID=2692789 RepID=UPI0016876873|nr:PAS domain S-box protein [Coleofasciculus sp. FACHB-712]MBD1945661.1 PAS domain S-box protein [Coleofasciculus sp. FACHB-712]